MTEYRKKNKKQCACNPGGFQENHFNLNTKKLV